MFQEHKEFIIFEISVRDGPDIGFYQDVDSVGGGVVEDDAHYVGVKQEVDGFDNGAVSEGGGAVFAVTVEDAHYVGVKQEVDDPDQESV